MKSILSRLRSAPAAVRNEGRRILFLFLRRSGGTGVPQATYSSGRRASQLAQPAPATGPFSPASVSEVLDLVRLTALAPSGMVPDERSGRLDVAHETPGGASGASPFTPTYPTRGHL